MFASSEDAGFPESTEAVLLDAVSQALAELNVFREREGAEIAAEMSRHNGQVAVVALEMELIRDSALAAFQNRLTERLKDLLKGAQVDPQRLAQEAAILADRSDIGEELARLKIHAAQLAVLLDEGGEADEIRSHDDIHADGRDIERPRHRRQCRRYDRRVEVLHEQRAGDDECHHPHPWS